MTMEHAGQTQTPMSDHVARFWQLLKTEHVRILVDIRRDHDEGQPPHWDSASFGNDVAKALAAAQSRALGEGEWQWVPKKPTDEMGTAGWRKAEAWDWWIGTSSDCAEIYRAMLAASPAPSGDAQVTEKMLIAASLAWCNELRKQNGLASTDRTEMSQDARDIIKAALTAAIHAAPSGDGWREERERCARIADPWQGALTGDPREQDDPIYQIRKEIAAAIRALPPPPAHNAGEAAGAKGESS